jgi:transcriptional regulator with XRE-family HTH domain
MKEKEIEVDCPYQQVILYAEKADGTYGPVQTGSYMAGNHISEHFRITGNLSRTLLDQLRKGEISPVYYYMTLEGLTITEIAGRTGISKCVVKRHIRPEGFRRMRISSLKRYADVLNIPVANMFQIINTIEDRNWDIGYQGDIDRSKTGIITQSITGNPMIIETKVITNEK